MAQTSVTKCINCPNNGIYFCYDCKSAMCSQCRETHDRFPALSSHSVTDLKSVDRFAFTTTSQCTLHKQPFSLYCKPCSSLICSRCVANEHNRHDISEIDNAVDEMRKTATEKVKKMKEKLEISARSMEEAKKVHLPKIENEAQSAISSLNAAVSSVINIINSKKDIILNEIEDSKSLHIQEMEQELQNKEKIYNTQKALCDSLENILKEKHSVTFFLSFENLKKDIHEGNMEIDIEPSVHKTVFNTNSFLTDFVRTITDQFGLKQQNDESSEPKAKETLNKQKDSADVKEKDKESHDSNGSRRWEKYVESVMSTAPEELLIGVGIYGSDGITYGKSAGMPEIETSEMKDIIKSVAKSYFPTAMKFNKMNFICIKSTDDIPPNHFFKRTDGANMYEKYDLFIQSTKTVTIVSLLKGGYRGPQFKVTERMRDIISFLKEHGM